MTPPPRVPDDYSTTAKGRSTRLAPFDALTHRGQARRLRHIAIAALRDYPIEVARIALLQYEDNAVYEVTSGAGGRFILRVGAADGHGVAELRAELLWLDALRRDTDLVVPIPVPTGGGEPLTIAQAPGVPELSGCTSTPSASCRLRGSCAHPGAGTGCSAHPPRYLPPASRCAIERSSPMSVPASATNSMRSARAARCGASPTPTCTLATC